MYTCDQYFEMKVSVCTHTYSPLLGNIFPYIYIYDSNYIGAVLSRTDEKQQDHPIYFASC